MNIKPEDLPDDWFNQQTLPMADEFRIEFHSLIEANHKLVLGGIDREEKEAIEGVDDEGEIRYHRSYFDELRVAANNLAIVAIVTRLDHWVRSFMKSLNLREDKPGKKESRLIKKMEALNKKLGDGPIPLADFDGLVNARDSVIHGDSKSNWEFPEGVTRWVADENIDVYDLVVSVDQVNVAVEKTLKQLIWYDDRIKTLKHP